MICVEERRGQERGQHVVFERPLVPDQDWLPEDGPPPKPAELQPTEPRQVEKEIG